MIACQGNNDQNMLWQNVASAYHSACDSYTTFPFSTPGIISLSSFVEPNICTSLDKACIEGYYSNSQCSKSYFSSPQSFGDCLCNPSLLSLRYDCLYLGGIYCSSVGSPFPNISTILGWSVCAGYQTIMVGCTWKTISEYSLLKSGFRYLEHHRLLHLQRMMELPVVAIRWRAPPPL